MPPNSHRHTRSRSHSHSHSHAPPPPQLVSIDPKIWRACAGNSVTIPTLHSRVYYFPQGHLEHSTSSSSAPVLLSPLVLSQPLILCRIAAVQFLADPTTDEVLAKLLLHPVHSGLSTQHRELSAAAAEEEQEEDDDDGDRVVSFAKILTPSDANNGGGFSVPRFCADSIFPPLNYQAEPPVQTLSVTDLHGGVWDLPLNSPEALAHHRQKQVRQPQDARRRRLCGVHVELQRWGDVRRGKADREGEPRRRLRQVELSHWAEVGGEGIEGVLDGWDESQDGHGG